MRKLIQTFVILSLVSCASLDDTKVQELEVSQINDGCRWYLTGWDTKNCQEWSDVKVAIPGKLYYSEDHGEPEIHPHGATEESDVFIPIHRDSVSESEHDTLRALHGKNVKVVGTLNTDCVIAGAWASQQMNDTGDIIMLSGYCHFQDKSYLTNTSVTEDL